MASISQFGGVLIPWVNDDDDFFIHHALRDLNTLELLALYRRVLIIGMKIYSLPYSCKLTFLELRGSCYPLWVLGTGSFGILLGMADTQSSQAII